MNDVEIKEAIERYNRRLQEFGATEKALGWGNKGRSRLRFEILLSQWDFNGSTVLDFGCGFGDLFAYLSGKNWQDFHYLGLDINPSLIEVAQKRHPQASFQTIISLADIQDTDIDFILASGTFNHKLNNNFAFVQESFDKFVKIAKKGFAANFLSNKVDYELENTYHADPAAILNLAYTYTNNVILRNDYMPYEFTIFVNLGEAIDKELTVYEQFVKYERP
ncbi:MAG: class I SAM-dependent methyltransferase [Candidatus Obscuribacterales bacterium]|nr:class I SAM-dependent methyltransferase [Candidatus Obscuribacterales bacterium]